MTAVTTSEQREKWGQVMGAQKPSSHWCWKANGTEVALTPRLLHKQTRPNQKQSSKLLTSSSPVVFLSLWQGRPSETFPANPFHGLLTSLGPGRSHGSLSAQTNSRPQYTQVHLKIPNLLLDVFIMWGCMCRCVYPQDTWGGRSQFFPPTVWVLGSTGCPVSQQVP